MRPAYIHGDLVSPTHNHSQIVCDQNHRHEPLALLLLKEIKNLSLHGHVEGCGGLISEQQLGPTRRCDSNDNPLGAFRRTFGRDSP